MASSRSRDRYDVSINSQSANDYSPTNPERTYIRDSSLDRSDDIPDISSPNRNDNSYSSATSSTFSSPSANNQSLRKPEVKIAAGNQSVKKPEKKTAIEPIDKIELTWKWWIVGALVVLFIGCIIKKDNSQPSENQRNCTEFMKLKYQFPRQDNNLFKYLKVGVEGVLNKHPTKPSIFAMISNDTNYMENFMTKVIKTTQNCFKSNGYINITAKNLSESRFVDDYSLIIDEYKGLLESVGIMVINDFNKVPSAVVPVFHSFCDVESPLVKKSVIFLTMHIPELQNPVGNPTAYLHNFLQNLWENDIKSNILDALITRITDQVFIINSN